MAAADLFRRALEMCQLGLASLKDEAGKPLRREDIESEVDAILSMPRFADGVDREQLIRHLEEIFTIWSEQPTALDDNDNHVPWLLPRKGEIDWRFWSRYKLYLVRRQKLSPAAIDNVDLVTDEVLGRLEDPGRNGAWDRRGLVMGHVQSGKTGAYVGLICKAADAGYKVIIVLAGLHNNLRSQTQIRLDEGFLGYKAIPPQEGGGNFEPTGVAEFGRGPKADSVTNRNENGDFSRRVAQHFGIHPGGNPLLFVVKKNTSVLKNLLGWIDASADFQDPETGRKIHRDIPLLVIDDEADQASVDTRTMAVDENGNPDDEHDPTKTNKLIRKLLFAFDKSAYVGFTATPFANIFIHDKGRTKDLGDDLFPRSFIVNLPAPSNYTGASRIFGIKEDSEAGLQEIVAAPITRTIEDHADTDDVRETSGWMPPVLLEKTGHVPQWKGARTIPPSLREAVMCFLLSTAVRSLREDAPLFNSMLVHVVRFTNVQDIVYQEVREELKLITDRLTLGDGTRRPSIIDEFKDLWELDYEPTTTRMGDGYSLPAWKTIAGILPKIALSIEVRIINGSAADALDYEDHQASGLNVIAIGGDKLSRGLTLEGLTVSYFLRSSRMYDTLMQMGRWFGYRERYLDVCRLYTTAELRDWFAHIAAATEELRLEFDYMVSVRGTPKDYGLKIRSHPALLVTSAVKMKHGTEMRLSYAGDISETIVFDTREPIVESNLKAVRNLVEKLRPPDKGGRAGGYGWAACDVGLVLDFLASYVSHPDARRADTKLLSRYIRRQNEAGELTEWYIKLVSSGDSDATRFDGLIRGLELGANYRAPYPDEQKTDRYSIRRLVNPSDEDDDLDEDEYKVALARTQLLWEGSKRKNKSAEPPSIPSGQGIRYARPKGRALLMLYPLKPPNPEKLKDPIMGIAISFPESDTAKAISYQVNNVFSQAGDYDDF